MLVAVGIYLFLSREMSGIMLGLIITSIAVNLAIFVAGRLTSAQPALIASNSQLPPVGFANPLPQALILTAIVIGFGLFGFFLIIAYRALKM